jgi:hypothetical protein
MSHMLKQSPKQYITFSDSKFALKWHNHISIQFMTIFEFFLITWTHTSNHFVMPVIFWWSTKISLLYTVDFIRFNTEDIWLQHLQHLETEIVTYFTLAWSRYFFRHLWNSPLKAQKLQKGINLSKQVNHCNYIYIYIYIYKTQKHYQYLSITGSAIN